MREAPAYATWAPACYEARIAPLVAGLPDRGVPLAGDWRASCAPGAQAATRARLFPGAFFLLWIEALGGRGAGRGAEPLAAAIELLHNATLVHDDVLDGHVTRRAQATLLGRHGVAGAVLGGDGLQADALSLLGQVEPQVLARCLPWLAEALRDVALGQWLDEPAQWDRVARAGRLPHWRRVCALKLAMGGVGAPLAACWLATGASADAASLAPRVRALTGAFALVSQIVNDLGDWFDLAGLHTPSPSGRARFEESRRKPTLPALWLEAEGCELPAAELPPPPLCERVWQLAHAEIAAHKDRARAALDDLELAAPAGATLRDYFEAPRLPDAWRAGGQER